MTDLEAINLRASRRWYTGALPGAQLDALDRLVAALNRESALAMRLVRDGGKLFGGFMKNYGRFGGVNSFFSMVGYKSDPDLREKLGYYGERLVLELTKSGLGACWVTATFDREGLRRLLDYGQELAAVITFGPVAETPAFQERTIARTTHRGGKTPQQMYTADAPPPDWFLAGVAAAARAPSAYNRQPVHFYWERGVARISVPQKSNVERIDLGIAKLHFEIAAGGRFEPGNGAAFGFLVSGGEPYVPQTQNHS